ncbi:endo-beta-N-acetylglucosaminidase [Paenibacillus thiaminolyticus]|uniref:EndoS/ChiA family endoglycosidase n=1 Tax=Paenibacillus thiaminolyticus TaxID=49283 RepID=UPI00232CB0CB|nr:endo-beta-N-acetylglucosaminidase [Paenibacillus thiaminolyticus]WCF07505.1 endo-beta-N-acetylglucosaminidase [Paenibacillus thiaminolyticus]
MKKKTSLLLILSTVLILSFMSGSIITASPSTSAVNEVTEAQKAPVMMAYYRTWRDVTMPHDANSTLPYPNVTAMTDIPEEVDIVSVFHYVKPGTDEQLFWDTLRDTYVPILHERHTKVIRTIDIRELYNVPSMGIMPTSKEYDDHAQTLIDKYLTPYNLDGLDIDMEENLTQEKETKAFGVFEALSKRLGPMSNSGKLLIYDTNKDNHSLFKKVAPFCDYLFLQAYGRDPGRLDSTWATYRNTIFPDQFLPGISFQEELGANWADTQEPFETSRAYKYAVWQPEDGPKGGMFIYAIDRDGKEYGDNTITETDFSWTKKLIDVLKNN